MRGRIKSATYNVNQMGEFWCFFYWHLRRENILTRDVLSEFHCNSVYFLHLLCEWRNGFSSAINELQSEWNMHNSNECVWKKCVLLQWSTPFYPSSLCMCSHVTTNELFSVWGSQNFHFGHTVQVDNDEVHSKCLVFDIWCLSNIMLLAIVNQCWKCLWFTNVQIHFGDKLISSWQEQGLELGQVWLVVICRLIVAALPPTRRQQWQSLDFKIRSASKHLHCANACWKDTSLRFSTIILQINRDLKRI